MNVHFWTETLPWCKATFGTDARLLRLPSLDRLSLYQGWMTTYGFAQYSSRSLVIGHTLDTTLSLHPLVQIRLPVI